MKIEDGKGSGRQAEVSNDNKLEVNAISNSLREFQTDIGQAYNINTDNITLTNATNTTVLYMKNTNDRDLHINSFIYNLGTSTGGSGNAKVDIIANPNTGGIITNAVKIPIIHNRNFSSNASFIGLAYKGASGETLVNGSTCLSSLFSSSSGRTIVDVGVIILKKGNSIAVNYTPPTGNTSQAVQFAAACFFAGK